MYFTSLVRSYYVTTPCLCTELVLYLMRSFTLSFCTTALIFFVASATPKIYTIGDEVLRQPSRTLSYSEITSSEDVARAAAEAHIALENFRRENGFGRGIAAPQIGETTHTFVLF